MVIHYYMDFKPCKLSTGNITGEFVRIYLGIKKGLSSHEASNCFYRFILATFSLFIIGLFSFVLLFLKIIFTILIIALCISVANSNLI